MARLKLRGGSTYGEAGKLLIQMAGAQAEGAELTSLERRFENLFDDRFTPTLDKGAEEEVHLVFHYDRTEKSGVRVINVVVPDLSAKLARKPEPGTLDDVAAEAFGYVTIMGCAG